VGAFTSNERLVGHIPIEFSKIMNQFITKDGNRVELKVLGKRKREVGLVVPVKCIVLSAIKNIS
jgi:hypothetical protein